MAVRATGRVIRLYPNESGCYIRLDYQGVKPLRDYFFLEKSFGNYNSLYSLAVVAAVNGYNLQIRTREDITPTEHAKVVYMVVDW